MRLLILRLLVCTIFLLVTIKPTYGQVDCITCGGTQPNPKLEVESFLKCVDVKKSISADACSQLKSKYEDKCCNAAPVGGGSSASKGGQPQQVKKKSGGGGGGGGSSDLSFYLGIGALTVGILTLCTACFNLYLSRRTTMLTLNVDERLELLEKDIMDLAETGISASLPKGALNSMKASMAKIAKNSKMSAAAVAAAAANGGGGGAASMGGVPIVINNSKDVGSSLEDKEAQEEERMLEMLRERIIGDMSNLYYQMKNNTMDVSIRHHKYIKWNVMPEECYIEDDKRIWTNYNETYDDFFSKFILYGSQISSHYNIDLKLRMDDVLSGFVKANKILQATYYNKEKGSVKITPQDIDDDSDDSDSSNDKKKKKKKKKSKKNKGGDDDDDDDDNDGDKKPKKIPKVFKQDTSKFDNLINNLMTEIVEFDTEMADHIQIEKMKNIRAREQAAAAAKKEQKRRSTVGGGSVGATSRHTATTAVASYNDFMDDIDENMNDDDYGDDFGNDHDDMFDDEEMDEEDYRRREDRAILGGRNKRGKSSSGVRNRRGKSQKRSGTALGRRRSSAGSGGDYNRLRSKSAARRGGGGRRKSSYDDDDDSY